jgi:5-oxopent-3-ene-1,2,5-tricarboxylate decarboxylase/2-hydroxyhepta-2,4-diene-1,7-dioate isomerase
MGKLWGRMASCAPIGNRRSAQREKSPFRPAKKTLISRRSPLLFIRGIECLQTTPIFPVKALPPICDALDMPGAPRSVIGVALNFQQTVHRLAASFHAPPHQHPPQAPVLYLKTPNTWIDSGHPIHCPPGIERLRMAGTLGVVLARNACRVSAAHAHAYIAAYTVVNDISLPHDSFYRPALRQRCTDGFCVIGEPSPSAQTHFEIGVVINNVLRSVSNTSSLVRSIAHLIQDISEFMTLLAGDILLVGEPETSPLAAPGDSVRIEIPGVGAIENKVVAS